LITKLKHVLRNNVFGNSNSKLELYIQALVDAFIEECKMSDSLHLRIIPSRFRFVIVNKIYVAFNNRENKKR